MPSAKWIKIHDFHQKDDPLERDSPSTALRYRGKHKNKGMRATLILTSSFAKKPQTNATTKTSSFGMAKSSSVKPLTKKKKQWELPPFEEKKVVKVKKDPDSPVSTMMSNSIVLKCYAKKPLKDIYQGPEMRSKGDIAGRVPCARDGHTALNYNGKMVVFGGDRHKISFGDIHYFLMNQ